jgi:hypothetical protein
MYRELKKLNSQKCTDPTKKWAKEEVQMAKNHMKKCPPSLAIKAMQIYLTPAKIATIKNTNNNKRWGGYGKKRTLAHCW